MAVCDGEAVPGKFTRHTIPMAMHLMRIKLKEEAGKQLTKFEQAVVRSIRDGITAEFPGLFCEEGRDVQLGEREGEEAQVAGDVPDQLQPPR